MKKILFHIPAALCLAIVFALASCEQPVTGDVDDTKGEEQLSEGDINVKFNVCNLEMMPFDDAAYAARRVTDIRKACTRIELAVFKGDRRVAIVRQDKGDKVFGQVSLSLDEGEYTVVVIAHNGEGTATVTSPNEIKFKDNKVTDTFYYCGDITVDSDSSYDLTLKRAVAMVRFVAEDKVPAGVSSMRFYYTGGSSTFDAVNGCGCVNSRQTEIRDVPAAAHTASSHYDIYTFPHSDDRPLNITVTALNASGGIVDERKFEDVKVERNQITRYSGIFFGESPGAGRCISITVDNEWTQVDYSY